MHLQRLPVAFECQVPDEEVSAVTTLPGLTVFTEEEGTAVQHAVLEEAESLGSAETVGVLNDTTTLGRERDGEGKNINKEGRGVRR